MTQTIKCRATPRRAPAGRRTAGILCLLGLFALTGCKVELYTGLDEREANEMVAVLLHNGIWAQRLAGKDGSSTVRIDEADVAPAVDLLKARGYPRQTFETLGDVFSGDGLVSSPTEERARFIYALSQELSRTISDIDGVLTARIHVALPKNDPLRQNSTPSSASVFIRHDSAVELNPLLPQIKMLMANSIEGLTYDNVSMVLVPVEHQPIPVAGAAGPAGGVRPGGADPIAVMVLVLGFAACAGAGGVWLVRRRGAGGVADAQWPAPESGAAPSDPVQG